MQMIEVSVGNQHRIQRRKIGDAQSGTPQPLEHKEPGSKDGIDYQAGPAGLQEERGVSDEGDAQLSWRGQHGTMRVPRAPGHGGMLDQPAELTRFFAYADIEHPYHWTPPASRTIPILRRSRRLQHRRGRLLIKFKSASGG
jgi:hypothetical protein